MSVKTVTLPPNATYRHRRAEFAKVTPDDLPVAGILQVGEAKTLDLAALRTRRYAIQEVQADGPHERKFRVTKPLVEGGEAYYVLLVAGEHPRCTCRGQEAGGTCVHAQALHELKLTGFLAYHARLRS